VENLSFTAPIFAVAGIVGTPGTLNCLFYANPASCTNPVIPPPGVVSSAFVPTPSIFQNFPASCTLANGAASTDPTQ
jgi:hypothetical protein